MHCRLLHATLLAFTITLTYFYLANYSAGNAGVTRTAVGELTHNRRLNPGKSFSLFGFSAAFGYIIGPALGGYLSNPAKKYGFNGPGNVFVQFPFLLPCLVSGALDVVVFMAAWLFLEETNQKVYRIGENGQIEEQIIPSETDALLPESERRRLSRTDDKPRSVWSDETIRSIMGFL